MWIDFFKNKITRQVQIFSNCIENNNVFFICPVVLQEILQGIKQDKQYNAVKKDLLSVDMLEIGPVEAAVGAADLYRELRKKGVTIKKSNDCLIAYYSIYFKIPLLHNDSDFDLIASHSILKIV